MRIFTVLSGFILCATGAFCFAFYSNTFSTVAFLIGVVMLFSGFCNTLAYLLSGKGQDRLTDTTLVEGLVTLFYGFAVINNQVTDATLTMFFGTWLTLCGITRFSESLYISRFNSKDWARILPLSALTTMLGVVMMMPWVLSSVMPLMLVGGALLLDGLSIMIYSMYMKKSGEVTAKGAEEAKQRADAKRALQLKEREERDRLRNLSKEEREAALLEKHKEDEREAQRLKAEKEAEKAKRKEEARPIEERTLRLSDDEVSAINAAAPAEYVTLTKKDVEPRYEQMSFDDFAEAPDTTDISSLYDDNEEVVYSASDARPVFKKPEVHSFMAEEKARQVSRNELNKSSDNNIKLAAVKLDDIENDIPIINFDKVELPEVKFVAEEDKIDRNDVMQELDTFKLPEIEEKEFTKLDVNDLIPEPAEKTVDPVDATRFTQTLNFDWISKQDEDLKRGY